MHRGARPVILGSVVAAAIACGGRPTTSAERPAADRATGTARTPATPPTAAPRPLDAADCGRLLDHYLTLELEALRGRVAADQVPTAAQVRSIKESFAREAMAGCLGAERPPFDCAMAARTREELRRCLASPGAAPSAPSGGPAGRGG